MTLAGVVTALATPFAADGGLDEARLRQLVDRSVDGGVGGVLAGGSTGEFAALSAAERRLVVETVVDQTAGRVPVVAQTGAMSTAEAIDLTRHAQDSGADVIMLVAPYYEALTVTETVRYLGTVAATTTLPVMLYNLPAATGVDLTPDVVRALATDVENITSIKDTTGDFARAAQLIHHHGDVIDTFVGWDSFCLASLVEGAAGVVAGTANVMPRELSTLYALVRAGEFDQARALWATIYPLIDTMLSLPFVSAVKAALHAADFNVGRPRDPVGELDATDAAAVATLVKQLQADQAGG